MKPMISDHDKQCLLAYLNGEEVECRDKYTDWMKAMTLAVFESPNYEVRMKPKPAPPVEGWVRVYERGLGNLYENKDFACVDTGAQPVIRVAHVIENTPRVQAALEALELLEESRPTNGRPYFHVPYDRTLAILAKAKENL